MSGFFGMVRTDGAAVERELLERIARRLEFRGPDGTSVWMKDNAGFCFTFLETGTAHQARQQPVCLGDRFWLAGDVRLDGRLELAGRLSEAGQLVAAGATDAELILLAWNAWGAEALATLWGDFSFGLWDAQTQSLTCARDFAGARPFYYAKGPGFFSFSNTLQILRSMPEVSAELDERFVRDFLLEGQCRDNERTIWRAIRRLPPGYSLQFSSGRLSIRRFLQLPIEEPFTWRDPNEYLAGFRELLERAVSDRMPHGKTALYLSGGLDSASVCAMAARVAPERIASGGLKAFTVSWRPLMDDPEPEAATRTARYLGLTQEILQEERILPDSGLFDTALPEPTAEFFFGRACRLYRAISGHSRVVLAGDGGDNVLDGQAWPYLNYLWKRGDWKEMARSFGAYTASHGRFPALRGGFRSRVYSWFRTARTEGQVPAWLNEEFASRSQAQHGAAEGQSQESLPVHPVHPHAYHGLHGGYWGSVLEEEDVGWTGVNLESRAPFLDLRLLRYLLRLPPLPWCMHKELTRQSMQGLLPVEILTRRKTPLVRDPLEASQLEGGWQPEILKNPPKSLQDFVKWDNWLATLGNCKGLLSWECLYPLALAYWLKAVENEARIQ